VTLTAIQSITQEPWTDEELARVMTLSESDLSFIYHSFEAERFSVFKTCSVPGDSEFMNRMGLYEVPTWQPLLRAAGAYQCREALLAHDQIGDFFTTKPNIPDSRFAWHEARRDLIVPETSLLLPRMANAYARAISLRAQWRLAIAVNTVLKSYKETGKLAPNIAELGDVEWPIDPFDEQPLRYSKLADDGFVVYSIGPDEIDADGEDLYVSGVLRTDTEFDIGYRITLR